MKPKKTQREIEKRIIDSTFNKIITMVDKSELSENVKLEASLTVVVSLVIEFYKHLPVCVFDDSMTKARECVINFEDSKHKNLMKHH